MIFSGAKQPEPDENKEEMERKSVWRSFLGHSLSNNINVDAATEMKTLRDADADEDAMDIFGASKGQNLYTVHLYQVWCGVTRHDVGTS